MVFSRDVGDILFAFIQRLEDLLHPVLINKALELVLFYALVECGIFEGFEYECITGDTGIYVHIRFAGQVFAGPVRGIGLGILGYA